MIRELLGQCSPVTPSGVTLDGVKQLCRMALIQQRSSGNPSEGNARSSLSNGSELQRRTGALNSELLDAPLLSVGGCRDSRHLR